MRGRLFVKQWDNIGRILLIFRQIPSLLESFGLGVGLPSVAPGLCEESPNCAKSSSPGITRGTRAVRVFASGEAPALARALALAMSWA